MEKTRISTKYMAMIIASIFLFSFLYFLVGTKLFSSKLTYRQYLEFSIIISCVVAGGYQLYFWTQKNSDHTKAKSLRIKLDDMIPFWPSWVWIYSFLYYIIIGIIIASVSSIEQGIHLVFGGIILLGVQCIIFITYPVASPIEWRDYEVKCYSTRFLKFVHSFDSNLNCFPSMHCSLATYVGLCLLPMLGIWSYIFIGLIVISCLFTKQHFIADTIPGILLGYLVYLVII